MKSEPLSVSRKPRSPGDSIDLDRAQAFISYFREMGATGVSVTVGGAHVQFPPAVAVPMGMGSPSSQQAGLLAKQPAPAAPKKSEAEREAEYQAVLFHSSDI